MSDNFSHKYFPDIFDIKIETPENNFNFGEAKYHEFE